jgi:hypothetical protein
VAAVTPEVHLGRMVRTRLEHNTRYQPPYQPVRQWRCTRCLHHMGHASKYCDGCRRKVICIQIIIVLATSALFGLLLRYLLLLETTPAPIWIQ